MKILLEKGDSKEQIMMADALLASHIVRAIETNVVINQIVHKSDEEVAKAVVEVLKLFGVSTQWTAVYRILVDFCGWESDITKFTGRMNSLLCGNGWTKCRCVYQSIQKPLASCSILRKEYEEWKKYKIPKGDRVFKRQLYIAENLLKLLSISA